MKIISVEVIKKNPSKFPVPPNLKNYEEAMRSFTWDEAFQSLDGLPGNKGLNMAYEAVDRHERRGLADKLAIRFLRKSGEAQDFSYRRLKEETNRFANVLKRLGVQKGDKVFTLLGRVPELYLTCLGTLKLTAVYCPLFSAFGPEPVQTRLSLGEGRVLVTTEAFYQKKVAPIRATLSKLQYVILIDGKNLSGPGILSWEKLIAEADPHFDIPPTDPEDQALLHFTSGTTGRPKGAMHVHQAIVEHYLTGSLALDFHPEDIFWCTADPGWVTGTSYGIISPLTHGITTIVDEQDFIAERWYQILEEQKVSIWYTAPTAIRMMMKAGLELLKSRRYPALRFIASVGEPLNPEAVVWGVEAFGMPIHDNWWQTETGGIMIANFPAMDVRPGSMGRPLPGIEAAVVRREDEDKIQILNQPDQQGELVLKRGWPSMFRGYLHEEARYKKCFIGDWYLTGDLAKKDEDGYFWFVGRADDIIKSAGHLIGPFEVESALMEHPAVAEAGVIGKPDPTAGEVVKAFVSLKKEFRPSEPLKKELLGFARIKLGPAVAPKEIDFIDSLPKTRSGKIMRRLLKAREMGLPEGDTSTLETGS